MYAIVLLQGMVFYSPIATIYRQSNALSLFQQNLARNPLPLNLNLTHICKNAQNKRYFNKVYF